MVQAVRLSVVFFLLGLLRRSEEVPRIPLSYTRSLVSCELEFPKQIRSVYPGYEVVTGENFIAQYDATSCSIPSKQIYGDQSCSSDCTEAAGLLMDISGTLHYCYTASSPVPFSASLVDGVYEFRNETSAGMSHQCVQNPEKSSHWAYQNGVYYIATDGSSVYSSYNTTSAQYKTVEDLEVRSINQIYGVYATDSFVYSLYTNTSGHGHITRYCSSTPGSSSHIRTFTYTSLYCTVTIGGTTVKLTQLLAVERIGNRLYLLMTSLPVTSALVYMCEVDLDQMGSVFDGSYYFMYDSDGNKIKSNELQTVDCSVEQQFDVLKECVNNVSSEVIIATLPSLTTRSFQTDWTSNMTFFLSEGLVHVYRGSPNTSLDLIAEVEVWTGITDLLLGPSSSLQLVEGSTLRSLPSTWCSHYGSDPVGCVASRDPRCAYSTSLNQCTLTETCEETSTGGGRCVQELGAGNFSLAFPDGYSYTVPGTKCIRDTFYTDKVVTIHPNASTTETTIFRDCHTVPVTEAPVIDPDKEMSDREVGLLVATLVFAVAFTTLLLFTCHANCARTRMLKGPPPPPPPPPLCDANIPSPSRQPKTAVEVSPGTLASAMMACSVLKVTSQYRKEDDEIQLQENGSVTGSERRGPKPQKQSRIIQNPSFDHCNEADGT